MKSPFSAQLRTSFTPALKERWEARKVGMRKEMWQKRCRTDSSPREDRQNCPPWVDSAKAIRAWEKIRR